eukprot:900936-Rhodomonas_salina.1
MMGVGALCATGPLCEDGTYFDIPTSTCMECPSGGTSTPTKNYGVWSCQCPDGLSLSYNLTVDGQEVIECVDITACDGVLQMPSGQCWKHVWSAPVNRSEAEQACQDWGGRLADAATEQDLGMATTLFTANGHFWGEEVWMGAHDQRPGVEEEMWAWNDGTLIEIPHSSWRTSRPDDAQQSETIDCAVLKRRREFGGTFDTKLEDVACGVRLDAFICSKTAECRAGTYWDATGHLCRACPSNGYSTPGANLGVYSC